MAASETTAAAATTKAACWLSTSITATTTTTKAATTTAAAVIASTTEVAAWAIRCWRKTLLRLQSGNHAGLEVLLHVVLDVLNLATIAKFSNRESLAFTTSATSAANAVHVIFSFHRQAVVDDVRDGRDIQTPSCDVGSDQNLHTAVTKRHQAAVAQALA